MSTLKIVTLVLYFGALGVLAVYGLHRSYLAHLYLRHRGRPPRPRGRFADLPSVTVQLPIFNEMYVADRLIRSVCALDYPRDRLEIQVLDDSTDETAAIARRVVDELRRGGHDIRHLPRSTRRGFKAGALAAGLRRARGEFVAVFDADFVPAPDFLRRCIDFFTDPRVGMVQARWGHLNRGYSLLTRIQAIFLDGHFIIEHAARNRSGRFFNFNGTAGVWRRSCIEDAGGWQHDTLTEDLDLSYRAQLRGWKFVFLTEVESPAELPADMDSFKSQQHRWAKGSIQTGKKLLPAIWRSRLPLRVKLEATFHLSGNIAYLLMIVLSLLMFPSLLIRRQLTSPYSLWIDLALFLSATLSITFFYLLSQREARRPWLESIRCLPLVMSLGIGLSVNNARAVFEALLNRQSDFTRTPKLGVVRHDGPRPRWLYRARRSVYTLAEVALAAYFLGAAVFCAVYGLYASLPFLLLFLSGFAYTAGLSTWELVRAAALPERPAPLHPDGAPFASARS
jgi:cellulose synthase/poly-beta-1,6-N-acetylglucosamine synthase-like glycosyltransferase